MIRLGNAILCHQSDILKIIYYIDLFHSILQDVIMPVSTVITVTHLAQAIVRTTHATYREECVPPVKLDGLNLIVK